MFYNLLRIALNVVLSLMLTTPGLCQDRGIEGHRCVAFTRDGKKIIAGNSESRIYIWSTETGKLLSTLHYPSYGKVSAITISPDDKYLYATSLFDDCFFKIMIATGEVAKKYCNKNTWVSSIQVNSQGSLALAAYSITNSVCLWDLENGRIVKTFTGHKSSVGYASFSPDENHIISTSMGMTWRSFRTVKLWDIKTGICLDSLDSRQQNLIARYSPDGQYVVVGGTDSRLELFDAHSKKLLHQFNASDECFIYDAIFTTDSRNVICTSGTKLRIWKSDTGELIQDLSTKHSSCIRGIALDASKHYLVSVAEDGTAFLWDTKTWKVIRELNKTM
jgi:WD40 repeat protein